LKVSDDHVVSIHYTLTNEKGETLDSSIGAEPLIFIQGKKHIIPGLEDALTGKETGEKLKVTIPPEKAYGPRNDEMVQAIPRAEFGENEQIDPGMQFQADTDNGPVILTVVEVKDEEVVVDGNHPLSGITLCFDVEVVEVREATEEELSEGHVHGPGCQH
jgi:FKBP-type peptidyl-prolyl cis-trans isomerase SlyD